MVEKFLEVRDTTEVERLRAQHAIIKHAFGGLIYCPLDKSSENLRILDSATAAGFWLNDVRSELTHPDSAEMTGTDIVSYPEIAAGYPSNIRFAKQNILESWPEDWQNSFDLVHQRLVLVVAGNFDAAVKTIQRLIGLVKPGGWLQLVEYAMPYGPIELSDPPSLKLRKSIGNAFQNKGYDLTLNARLPELVEAAGGLTDIQSRNVTTVIGKGAPESLMEQCSTEINGMGLAFLRRFSKMPDSELRALTAAVLEEASDKGFEMVWRATWGRRPNTADVSTSDV